MISVLSLINNITCSGVGLVVNIIYKQRFIIVSCKLIVLMTVLKLVSGKCFVSPSHPETTDCLITRMSVMPNLSVFRKCSVCYSFQDLDITTKIPDLLVYFVLEEQHYKLKGTRRNLHH